MDLLRIPFRMHVSHSTVRLVILWFQIVNQSIAWLEASNIEFCRELDVAEERIVSLH
jgi:hypothetical protein